jgi:hypothetical protein
MSVGKSTARALWFERSMAILASLNLGLALFDLTYIPWRNFWLQGTIPIPLTGQVLRLPVPLVDCVDPSQQHLNSEKNLYFRTSAVTCYYDPLKGIEPHRDTSHYLATVKRLAEQIPQAGLGSPSVANTLSELRSLSGEMVRSNPFVGAGKSGTLEKIKNRTRVQVLGNRNASARAAFERFWSTDYLTPSNWQQRLTWFNQRITPLIATNYYRGIDESGEPVDQFGLLDIPFGVIFFLEFGARVIYLRRSRSGSRLGLRTGQIGQKQPVSWIDALCWRWYDLLLFFPFWFFLPGWVWLRGVAVAIRLHQARLIDLERLRGVAAQGLVGNIADDMTEAVVVQLLNQAQGAVQRGDLVRWLARQRRQNPTIANDIDELSEIVALLGKVTIQEVLPQIRPELQALIQHSLEQILNQAPAYATLKNLPGLGSLPTQLNERLAQEITQGLYQSLQTVAQDQVAAELARRLLTDAIASFGSEVQEKQVIEELQVLVVHLLEEAKLNYQGQSPSPTEVVSMPTNRALPSK